MMQSAPATDVPCLCSGAFPHSSRRSPQPCWPDAASSRLQTRMRRRPTACRSWCRSTSPRPATAWRWISGSSTCNGFACRIPSIFGYLVIVPDTPDGSRNIDALSLASRSTEHPLRGGLYRIDVADKAAIQLYISAPPSTPGDHNGPMIPVPNAQPIHAAQARVRLITTLHAPPGTLLWETRHFALAPELTPGRYRLRVEALTADSALSQHTQLIIYHLRQPK